MCMKTINTMNNLRVSDKRYAIGRKKITGSTHLWNVCHVTKVHRLKPGQGRRIFNGDKIRSMPSFAGEVKPSAPCRTILWHVLYSLASVNKNIRQGQIHYFLCPVLPALLLDDFSGRIAQRALVDEWGVFLCRHHSAMVLHSQSPLIYEQ